MTTRERRTEARRGAQGRARIDSLTTEAALAELVNLEARLASIPDEAEIAAMQRRADQLRWLLADAERSLPQPRAQEVGA